MGTNIYGLKRFKFTQSSKVN